jgi:hypothetical protein
MKTSHVDAWDNSFIMLTISEYRALGEQAPHGTHARYNAHLVKDEEPCDRCKDGEARYRRKLKARRLADQDETEQPRRSFTRTTVSRNEDEEDEGNEEEEEEEEEELEPDDAPSWRAAPAFDPAASWASTFEVLAAISGGGRVPTPSPNGRSRQIAIPSTNRNRTDPRTPLRAISAELRARKPRGPQAVKLLVKAAPYLTGGVNALPQYGEGLGCRPEDIAAAERIVVGNGKGR